MQHHHHQLSGTTHTVELEQLAELSEGLAGRDPGEAISASLLGLQGAELTSDGADGRLPAEAILARLSFEGPPEYPYVHGHFRRSPGDEGSLTVDLHTDALRKLSHLLHLQQTWGAGSDDITGRTSA
jgi:hypothetical protein